MEDYDYGQGGYDHNKINVGFNKDTAQFQIEIKGLLEPKSDEANWICQKDLNEVIAAFVQDKRSLERGLFDEEMVPEELTQLRIRIGKIIKDKYPELDDEDRDSVRQHAVAALNIIQETKRLASSGDGLLNSNTALIDGVRKFAMDVLDLDIDLIDRINPFGEGKVILSKAMTESNLRQVANVIQALKRNGKQTKRWFNLYVTSSQ